MSTFHVEQRQEDLYRETAAFHAALERLASAYEADPETRRDLLQEIHLALWRSFASFDGRCSLRTWVYRVAHNAAASHVSRQRKNFPSPLISLEEAEAAPDPNHSHAAAEKQARASAQSIRPELEMDALAGSRNDRPHCRRTDGRSHGQDRAISCPRNSMDCNLAVDNTAEKQTKGARPPARNR